MQKYQKGIPHLLFQGRLRSKYRASPLVLNLTVRKGCRAFTRVWRNTLAHVSTRAVCLYAFSLSMCLCLSHWESKFSIEYEGIHLNDLCFKCEHYLLCINFFYINFIITLFRTTKYSSQQSNTKSIKWKKAIKVQLCTHAFQWLLAKFVVTFTWPQQVEFHSQHPYTY